MLDNGVNSIIEQSQNLYLHLNRGLERSNYGYQRCGKKRSLGIRLSITPLFFSHFMVISWQIH